MNIFSSFLVLIVCLFVLIKSADYFIKGASSLSLRIGISPFVIGLTIVAMGTSAPELFVNILSGMHHETDISIGNILGSNIAVILLGLGLSSFFIPLVLRSRTIWKEVPFSLLGAFMVLLLGSDKLIEGVGLNVIGRIDGLVLLSFFVIFMVYSFGLTAYKNEEVESEKIEEYPLFLSLIFIIGGLIGLLLGAEFLIHSAVFIADQLGMSHNLIGLTIVAVGTSIPEIATSIIAARNKHIDILVGGIIGTVIFNVFLTLGLTSEITDLPFSYNNLIDACFLIFISILFFVFMFVGGKYVFKRWQGLIFIALYIAYITYAVIRG